MYVPAWPCLCPADLLRSPSTAERPFPFNAPHRAYFYRARNAIYHLFRALRFRGDETVLVPDYHSGNEVWAIRAAGASLRYYPIKRNLEPDLDALARLCRSGARALFVILFLGWTQPLKELGQLCSEHGMLLIADCALSLLSAAGGQPLGPFGDYAVFCLYKTLPVPNGGLLVQNGRVLEELAGLTLQPGGAASVVGRSLELMCEWIRARADASGKAAFALKRAFGRALTALGVERVPVGDTGFDLASVDLAMATLSTRLLRRFDGDAIQQTRRANFELLQRRLRGRAALVFEALDGGICPLFFPLLVPDKHGAAQALWRRGIGAVEFWNHGDPEARGGGFEDAQFLRDHVLELPIHQDVGTAQVEYMADQVLRLQLHF